MNGETCVGVAKLATRAATSRPYGMRGVKATAPLAGRKLATPIFVANCRKSSRIFFKNLWQTFMKNIAFCLTVCYI